jgi:hypothetical protein
MLHPVGPLVPPAEPPQVLDAILAVHPDPDPCGLKDRALPPEQGRDPDPQRPRHLDVVRYPARRT